MGKAPNKASSAATTIGFFLGFRLIVLVIGTRAFGLDPQVSIGLTLVFNFLCLALAALGAKDDAGARDLLRLRPIRWAVLFLAFTGASLWWTVAVSPSAALVYWYAMVADACMVTLVLRQAPRANRHFDHAGVCRRSMLRSRSSVAASYASDLRLGDEELLGPNQIGFVRFCTFFALFLIREQERSYKSAAAFLPLR